MKLKILTTLSAFAVMAFTQADPREEILEALSYLNTERNFVTENDSVLLYLTHDNWGQPVAIKIYKKIKNLASCMNFSSDLIFPHSSYGNFEPDAIYSNDNRIFQMGWKSSFWIGFKEGKLYSIENNSVGPLYFESGIPYGDISFEDSSHESFAPERGYVAISFFKTIRTWLISETHTTLPKIEINAQWQLILRPTTDCKLKRNRSSDYEGRSSKRVRKD